MIIVVQFQIPSRWPQLRPCYFKCKAVISRQWMSTPKQWWAPQNSLSIFVNQSRAHYALFGVNRTLDWGSHPLPGFNLESGSVQQTHPPLCLLKGTNFAERRRTSFLCLLSISNGHFATVYRLAYVCWRICFAKPTRFSFVLQVLYFRLQGHLKHGQRKQNLVSS